MGGSGFVPKVLVCAKSAAVGAGVGTQGTGRPGVLSKLSDWLQSPRQRRAWAWEPGGPFPPH